MADITFSGKASRFICPILVLCFFIGCKAQNKYQVSIEGMSIYKTLPTPDCPELRIIESSFMSGQEKFVFRQKLAYSFGENNILDCYDKDSLAKYLNKSFNDYILTRDTMLMIDALYTGGNEFLICSSVSVYSYKNLLIFMVSNTQVSSSMPVEVVLIYANNKFVVGPRVRLAEIINYNDRFYIKHFDSNFKELFLVLDEFNLKFIESNRW